ncbi:MAG: Cof-type HAD-IIB family hydrolase, partial [Treponema sp.]|nr:Cof-type HAD-IIB family hydrolase [Treponema sp.]
MLITMHHEEGLLSVRIIAYDLDGTVLNSRKEVSSRTREAINRAVSAGIYMIPATGRHLDEIPRPVKELASSFLIANNGAQVYSLGGPACGNKDSPCGHPRPPELIFSRGFDDKTALSLISEFRAYPAMVFGAFDNGGAFDSKGRGCEEGIAARIIARNNWRDLPRDLEKLITEENKSIIKLVMLFEDLEERQRILSDLLITTGPRRDFAVTYFAPDNIEILPEGINKGAALKFVAAKLGISMKQVMAIGDSDNDKEMIQEAGTGVAMG